MITRIQTSQGPAILPTEFTVDLAEIVLAAGWTITGPSWRPSRLDRFSRTVGGVTYILEPIVNHGGRPGLTYRVGLRHFVDNCYGEYCDHYRSLDEALQSV